MTARLPIQVAFRGIEPSSHLEELIHERSAALSRLSDRIHGLRVVVADPHHHHQHGRIFHVRVEISMPGKKLFVGPSAEDRPEHEDPRVAVRDAFEAAARVVAARLSRRRRRRAVPGGVRNATPPAREENR